MSDSDVIEYLIRPDHTVLEIHGPWDAFAARNGAPELSARSVVGRKLDGFVADMETRYLYAALVDRVLETGEPIRFRYRCDGPTCRRHMAMAMDRVAPDVVRFRSRLVRAEERPAQSLLDRAADRSDELLLICGWCKRVESEGEWREVEDFVAESGLFETAALPRLSHGICPSCEEDMDRLVTSAA